MSSAAAGERQTMETSLQTGDAIPCAKDHARTVAARTVAGEKQGLPSR